MEEGDKRRRKGCRDRVGKQMRRRSDIREDKLQNKTGDIRAKEFLF